MILYQLDSIVQYYVGWYGVCDETGAPDSTDHDTPCQTLHLPTSTYADDKRVLSWSNNKGRFREQLLKVNQIRNDGASFTYYDMEKVRYLRELYISLGQSEQVAWASADSIYANQENFLEMVCGKAYTIIVAAGTGGTQVGSTVSQIEIPEFRYTYVGTADTGLRLTPECCGYSD